MFSLPIEDVLRSPHCDEILIARKRVAIKRSIRKAGYVIDSQTSTLNLEVMSTLLGKTDSCCAHCGGYVYSSTFCSNCNDFVSIRKGTGA